MLFRDTPATELTQCGKASPPFSGEVLGCMTDAMQAERPFVVLLDTPALVPASRNPALVGAVFGGDFALRVYGSPEEGVGERDPADLLLSGPRDPAVNLQTSIGHTRKCLLSERLPDPDDPAWIDVDGDGKHRFHPGQCLEWFDAAAWKDAPWSARFDASAQLACARD